MVFQFTQPKRAATYMRQQELIDKQFQFTQPKRAATIMQQPTVIVPTFQFTQPKRAATWSALVLSTCAERFNSRSPNGLRHRIERYSHQRLVVSIHAAQTGCDTVGLPLHCYLRVSIHAAQTGCDPLQIRTQHQ